ncbi:hypothetical protein [Rhizobium tumorigenes]|uniref:hypothetical protein n=1 Tax=Rhizobium tumorigenes TaxID=2041385 RepID=UPI00241DAB2C|nr:hypothetical protein [Rhizobium tumorigenes]WFS01594.1 hypothetical protein PR016_02870 [Rhizobium tumorigenes]
MTMPANLTAPIFAFDVTSGGNFESETRMVLAGFGLAAGALPAGGLAACGSINDARRLAGAGSMLETMFIAARRNAPSQEIWLGRMAEVGTAEVRTLTISAPPASGGQAVIQIAGESISVQVNAGDTATIVAAALAAAINSYFNALTKVSLPFTATVATNVVTLTERHKGAFASTIDISIPTLDTVNALTGIVAVATTTPGAGVPDITALLAAMNDDPFEIIVMPFSDTANLTVLNTFLGEVSGRWSYAQQLYGHGFYVVTDTQSSLVTKGLAKDTWHLTMIPRFASGGFAEPDYVWVAAMVGRIAPWLGGGANGDVSRNQTGLIVEGLSAPRDRTYWPDYPTRDVFLKSGVSTWKVSKSGDVMVDKIITQIQTINGAPDTTFRDIQAVFQVTYALQKFRADLASEHSNKALAQDNPSNLDAISTPKDIKATLFHTYQSMPGVLKNAAAVLPSINVTIDADNPNRVNCALPLDRVNALDIFSGLARVYSQFTTQAA